MEPNPAFFRDLGYVFLAALAGGLLAWRLRQPVIIGHVLAIRHAFSYLRFPDEKIRTYLTGFREAMDSLQAKPSASTLPLPEVRELTLTDSALVGRSLRETRLRERFGVSVVAITRASGEVVLDPPATRFLSRAIPCACWG